MDNPSRTPLPRPDMTKPRVSRTSRAGLTFPIGRTEQLIRSGGFNPNGKRVAANASVFAAAVLEYLSSEVIGCAIDQARLDKKKKIKPRHIQMATRKDADLDALLAHVDIASGGVLPSVASATIKKSKKQKEPQE